VKILKMAFPSSYIGQSLNCKGVFSSVNMGSFHVCFCRIHYMWYWICILLVYGWRVGT
jgi:hypothetical protein